MHRGANLALRNKEFLNYMDHFIDHLKYTQLDGKTIDKINLTKDTLKYFDRIKSYETNYSRIACAIENNLFVEKLVQTAEITIGVVIFFSKKWIVKRDGIYKWERVNNKWKIVGIEITTEKIC